MIPFRVCLALTGLLAMAACGSDTTGPPDTNQGRCGTQAPAVGLAPGDYAVFDPTADAGCIALPAPGSAGAEYLYVALATTGDSGVYSLKAEAPGVLTASSAAAPPLRSPVLSAFAGSRKAATFHDMLRAREAALAARGVGFLGAPPVQLGPPAVGDKRSFSVCGGITCTSFVTVSATAKHVGERVAIYVDDSAPPNGYSQSDVDQVGALFDQYLYPIDTTAFGRESDIDGNGVVVVLLTAAVNRLSGSCPDQTVILGYFFGADLVSVQGSNHGEVFYGVVPDPGGVVAGCAIPKDFATQKLAPTFIHEFQHMISFNQHVLLRQGSTEETWLNEGFSHFAEELGGRQVPDSAVPGVVNARTQFIFGDVDNAYSYLSDPEGSALIEPLGSTGELTERGANWLFVRWLVDQFGGDPLGTAFTRAMLATNLTGVANVTAHTHEPFDTLLVQWQLANYLDDLPGFTPSSQRLQYLSWNFRVTFASLNTQAPQAYPDPYPLVPDVAMTTTYGRTGLLRIGSGPHVLVEQQGSVQALDLQLGGISGHDVAGALTPRVGVARIR